LKANLPPAESIGLRRAMEFFGEDRAVDKDLQRLQSYFVWAICHYECETNRCNDADVGQHVVVVCTG
jgi:hypothetical protein